MQRFGLVLCEREVLLRMQRSGLLTVLRKRLVHVLLAESLHLSAVASSVDEVSEILSYRLRDAILGRNSWRWG